jgi:hypothetical protein
MPHAPPTTYSLIWICLIISGGEYQLWSRQFLHAPVISSPFGPDILLSTLFSKHPRSALPFMWETKLHIHTKQVAELWVCIFNLYVSRQPAGRQKALNRVAASIPWILSVLKLFVHAILIC